MVESCWDKDILCLKWGFLLQFQLLHGLLSEKTKWYTREWKQRVWVVLPRCKNAPPPQKKRTLQYDTFLRRICQTNYIQTRKQSWYDSFLRSCHQKVGYRKDIPPSPLISITVLTDRLEGLIGLQTNPRTRAKSRLRKLPAPETFTKTIDLKHWFNPMMYLN